MPQPLENETGRPRARCGVPLDASEAVMKTIPWAAFTYVTDSEPCGSRGGVMDLYETAKIVLITLLMLSIGTKAICRTDGKRDFEELCAQCHGANGTGEGRTLTEANPSDLTLLSRKNGGKFPFEHVYRIVDGREMTASHRRAAMPFWGQTLQKPGQQNTAESDAEVKARILDIVEYIKAIQKK